MDVIASTDGDRADFPRLGNRFVVRGDATGGRFALIEHEIPPRALAAPTHTHQHEDEYSFVERYFEEMAPLLSGGGPPDFEELGRIQAKYGLTMDRESIGPLSERHGLTA